MISLNEHSGIASAVKALSALIDPIFAASGCLQDVLGLEYRSEQEQMGRATARAFENSQSLLFEAGTGVGKSLAYLLPGIIHSMETARPFVVSSHTIALQEQIRKKDLQICRDLFSKVPSLDKYKNFNVAMLVGRSNYLCVTRLYQAIQTKADLFPTEEQKELERILNWSFESKEGLAEELSPPPLPQVWEWVNADSHTCNPKNCDPQKCFFRKARVRLRKANVVILNHSLLFSLMSAGAVPGSDSWGVLLPEDFVVLDEAHTVPDIATDHFGLRISSYGVELALKKLYNSKRNKGLITRYGEPYDTEKVKAALAATKVFFSTIRQDFLHERTQVRVRDVMSECEPVLLPPLRRVVDRLAVLAEKQQGKERDELLDHRMRLATYANGIDQFLQLSEDDHVYWLERTGQRGQNITLHTAPIDVAPYLEQHLFSRNTPVVLTSATLATGQCMDAFRKKVGAHTEHAQIVASPFDFEANVRIFVATDAPPPQSGNGRLDLNWLVETILFCTLKVPGGSLVLFTNYREMHRVAELSEASFNEARRPLYVQGQGCSRSELIYRFSTTGNAVLFGTDSFWTGIDVPGPALSQVIITRLPFDNPGHPIAEAKREWIEEQGRNSFAEMTLPDAVIKFRQGIGRLIRKKTDRGLITLLDSRIVKREYGRHFLAALPKQNFVKFSKKNCEDIFEPYAQSTD